jgi:hypothetical protein
MVDFCVTSQELLFSSITKLNTPTLIIDALKHGMAAWTTHLEDCVPALTAGQLGATPALLTTAFHEQFHSIGWLHICFLVDSVNFGQSRLPLIQINWRTKLHMAQT